MKPIKKIPNRGSKIKPGKSVEVPENKQPVITYDRNGEPNPPEKGVKAYWILTVMDINQYFFIGTGNNCRLELNRLYSFHNHTHRTSARYADQEEINQKKPLRPTQSHEVVRLIKRCATAVSILADAGLFLTKDEIKRAYAKADKKLALNKRIQATHIKMRDDDLKKASIEGQKIVDEREAKRQKKIELTPISKKTEISKTKKSK